MDSSSIAKMLIAFWKYNMSNFYVRDILAEKTFRFYPSPAPPRNGEGSLPPSISGKGAGG